MAHKRLHLTPNPNLLSTQSIANLQHLLTIPADVAAAANFPAAIQDPASTNGSHDHLQVNSYDTRDWIEISPQNLAANS